MIETSADGDRILRILQVDHSHSGEVTITLTSADKKEEITDYTSLTVFPRSVNSIQDKDVPPYIVQGPKDCTALIGGEVVLNVTFGGHPKPEVTWFKGWRPLTENANVKIVTTETHSSLELTSITADDSGKYTVEVKNIYSNEMASASVGVEGPPEPPSGKPSVSEGPDRISVAWCGPPYDGGCMLTGFIIEMQENDTDWRQIATVDDSLAYTIKNLKHGLKYRFRVCAKNIHGAGDPSLPSDIVTFGEQRGDRNKDFLTNMKSGGDFKSRFEVIDELGKGRFGVVYKVIEKETRHTLAAKIVKCIKSRDKQKVQEEIAIMRKLKHPKLLQLAATFENPKEIIMVMEYITGGELFERVVADDFTLTERDCILFVRQICEGVDYMHSQSIVHLDLKPENIMCHTRKSHEIKIIDFGLAQQLDKDTPMRVLFGTPEFIPPEIINYEPISYLSDMWSIGVICYVLLSGLSPFMGDTDVDTFSNITRADYDFEDEAFDAVSQEAKDFISSLLIHKKENRLNAEQCLQAKWLTQFHDETLNNRICTDKLKKFIIRRKWQKTGNAIRALGRMANLSASRRNSMVSTGGGSYPNSPRPSISGFSQLISSSQPMQSVNEDVEDDMVKVEIKELRKHLSVNSFSGSKRDKSHQCSERSDSGFSECSNCSGSLIICCERDDKVKDLSIAISHDILKNKLEEIAKSQSKISELDVNENDETDLCITEKEILSINEPPKQIILKSESSTSLNMRKQSLESNAKKERHRPKPVVIFDKPGKVSLLKTKFIESSPSPKEECPSPVSNGNGMKVKAASNVFDRLSSVNKSTKFSTSVPNSPIPSRFSPHRLSGRVREVTERLSQPKTFHKHSSDHNPLSSTRITRSPSPHKSTEYITTLKSKALRKKELIP